MVFAEWVIFGLLPIFLVDLLTARKRQTAQAGFDYSK